MKKYIKIYGDRRTGTNFIQQLCRQNFNNVDVFDNQFGWKHGPPKNKEEMFKWISKNTKRRSNYGKIFDEFLQGGNKLYPCVIIKNPYSWYLSIKNYIGKMANRKFNLAKLYKRYNMIYSSYKEMYEGKYGNELYSQTVVVKYEDLLVNAEQKINEIAEMLGLKIKTPFVVPNKVYMSDKFTDNKKKFYLSGGAFGLSDTVVQKINNLMDWDLMKFYGYERIEG
jgi:hypothetical protein